MAVRQRWFTFSLVAATLLGVAVGWICNRHLTSQQAVDVAANLSIITDAFLRLIKMVIAPLVFASLVTAIARMGGAAERLRRVGGKSCVATGAF